MTLKLHDCDSHIAISNHNDTGLLDHIPAAVYTYRATLAGPILQKDRKRFEIAPRTYGKHNQHLKMISGAYDPLGASLGIILEGIKGAGKSLLAEALCNQAITLGRPVYRIDTALDENALRFLVSISPGGCVLYFDEFGKIYDRDARDSLLSFFADQSIRGVMMILTANDTDELSGFMLDRPGRFQYRLRYEGLDVTAAHEVAKAYRLDPAYAAILARATAFHESMSYDILIALARMASEAKSLDDLMAVAEISNVPSLVYNHYDVTRVSLDGIKYGRDNTRMRVVDDILTLTVLDSDGQTLIDQVSIDLMSKEAVHLDTEVDYPAGLALGNHSLSLSINGFAVRLLFRRALADLRNRMSVSLPSETEEEPSKEEV